MRHSIEISRANFDKIVLEVKQMREIEKERELTTAEKIRLDYKLKIAAALKYRLTKEGKF